MRLHVGSLLICLSALACSAPGAPPTSTPGIATASASPSLATAIATAPPSPSASSAPPIADGPPAASLAAEGGDPVIGQLGTYTWRDGGSDSPWLPGAAIAVGAREPLTVVLDPTIGVEAWSARYVAAAADGPAHATPLGEGRRDPTFEAPEAGAWTVEVHVDFDDGLGDASYFWRLDVS
jgi:hypothetical protein